MKRSEYYARPVFAALAVSYAILQSGNEDTAGAQDALVAEWWTLYDNGIVPQKPTKPRPV